MSKLNQTPGLTPEQAVDLRNAFTAMDANTDGMVTKMELQYLMKSLGEQVSDNFINDMIQRADVNHDGKIQFNEFIDAAIQDGQQRRPPGSTRDGSLMGTP